MKKILFSSLILVLLTCCTEEADPSKATYFTLEVDLTYDSRDTDDWVLIHNWNGTLLGYSPFEAGEIIAFDTFPDFIDKKISVTLLKVSEDNGANKFFNFETFLLENSKARWYLKNPPPLNVSPPGPATGNLIVRVTDPALGSPFDAMISTKHNSFFPEVQGNTFVFPSISLTTNENDVFLSIMDNTGKPRYKFLENVTPGVTDLTLADFNTFDKEVEFNFPASTSSAVTVSGYEADDAIADQGYFVNSYLSGIFSGNETSTRVAGYLNRFPRYRTGVSAGYPGYSLRFFSVGGVPSSVTLTDAPSTTLVSNNFKTFGLAGSMEFKRRRSFWYYTGLQANRPITIAWQVHAAPEYLTNPASVPAAISSKYTTLSTALLNHYETELYTESTTLAELIAERFKQAPPSENFVQRSKSLH
jgi:hypothetical protein